VFWFDVDVSYESYCLWCHVFSCLYLSADVSGGGVVLCCDVEYEVFVLVGFCDLTSAL